MKTAILKLFSWATLLEFIAKLRLGNKAWELIRDAVGYVESSMPSANGSAKFAAALNIIISGLRQIGIELSKSLLNWGIESAVSLLAKRA